MIVIDMDMPESCNECPLFDNEYLHCQKTKERCETWEFKPTNNCPIKCDIEQIRAEIEQFVGVSIHDVDVIAKNDVLLIIDKYAEQEPCEDDYQTDMDEAWKQAKREPCDDAISRQAVLDVIKSMSNANPSYWNKCDVVDREYLIDEISELPSVRPQEQTGKWLEHENGRWIYAKCSECKTIHDSRSNYCPFCGARMDGYFAGLTKLRGE